MNQWYHFAPPLYSSDQKVIKKLLCLPQLLEHPSPWQISLDGRSRGSHLQVLLKFGKITWAIVNHLPFLKGHQIPVAFPSLFWKENSATQLPSFCLISTFRNSSTHTSFSWVFPDISPHPQATSPLNCAHPNQSVYHVKLPESLCFPSSSPLLISKWSDCLNSPG